MKPYCIYFIEIETGRLCFYHEFRKNLNFPAPNLFSGFVSALSMFASSMIEDREEIEKINLGRLKLIPMENLSILFNYGKFIMGTLIIEKNDDLLEKYRKLEEIIKVFEDEYKNILMDWKGELTLFDEFDKIAELIFKKSTIFRYQIPKFKNKENVLKRYSYDFIEFINGENSVQEIVNRSEEKGKFILDKIEEWEYELELDLSSKIDFNDVFEPEKELFYLLRSQDPRYKPNIENSKINRQEFLVLSEIDGLKSVKEIIDLFKNNDSITEQMILEILSKYSSDEKYIKKIELCPLIIKINEDIKKQFHGEELALIYTLENLCDGERSIKKISKKTGIPFSKIKSILNKLSEEVSWRKRREILL
ncbi:MAG: hypothetical protein GF329_22370 [Candidatus Lokiarchaeota archaeon]|nr:hypothetical protein [Candidatus Lokiarchaeota archaeon]